MAETIKATINMLTDSRQEFIKGAQQKENGIQITLEAKKRNIIFGIGTLFIQLPM